MRSIPIHKQSGMNRRSFLETSGLAATSLLIGGAATRALSQDMRLTTVGGTASTRYGRVRGLLKDGVQQFWGVPYGASTAGANRFMPPQPPEPWSGVRDHFQISNNAVIAPDAQEPAPVVTALNRRSAQGEDCLTVNVFTPALDNTPRPVMVWMHGGGFSAGAGNYLLYDGTNLAKKEDVVVVVVNHRLNIFGFLHLADIGGEQWAQATNVGVQDLVATLAWVRDNIENFGGDPDRVTIFGQSGGGGKTTTLMAMPSAEGLFHRSIAQSGSRFRGMSGSDASEAAERFLGKLGLGNNQLDRLQTVTIEQIQDAYYGEPRIPGLGNGPVVDGNILPRNQWDPTAPPYSVNVPFMMGSTETEDGWVGPPPYDLSDEDMLEHVVVELANNDASEGQRLLDLYKRLHPDKRNQMLWLTAESDNTRRWNAQELGRLRHEQDAAPSYLYFFDWYSPVHNNRMGAYHTLDIPFVFYNMDIGASMTGSAQGRYELGHVMSAAWAAFARNGNPDHADMPHWPAFNPTDLPTMMFGDEVRVANDPNREARLALAALRGAAS
ncbi:carboxylesterase/lipase family protein [Candidatus Rariloculus sp.]|uniref:carboxylesterase/lipase family protein n=1 Tax=Candidatus Rariloculus sp. TaxID=3101265 RepID=UPI003D14B12E